MKQTIIIIALAVVVLGGGFVYVLMQANSKNSSVSADQTTTSSSGADSTTAVSGLTIVFTNNGFKKSSYSVKAGTVVTVKNDSSMSVQFSSGSHPTHLEDPEINMEALAPGKSGTFTPTTKGSHDFHDHLHDQYTGVLVVE